MNISVGGSFIRSSLWLSPGCLVVSTACPQRPIKPNLGSKNLSTFHSGLFFRNPAKNDDKPTNPEMAVALLHFMVSQKIMVNCWLSLSSDPQTQSFQISRWESPLIQWPCGCRTECCSTRRCCGLPARSDRSTLLPAAVPRCASARSWTRHRSVVLMLQRLLKWFVMNQNGELMVNHNG